MPFVLHIAGEVAGATHNLQVRFDAPPPLHEVRRAAEALLTALRRAAASLRGGGVGGEDAAAPVLVETLAVRDGRRRCWAPVVSAAQLRSGDQIYCFPASDAADRGADSCDAPSQLPLPQYRIEWSPSRAALYQQHQQQQQRWHYPRPQHASSSSSPPTVDGGAALEAGEDDDPFARPAVSPSPPAAAPAAPAAPARRARRQTLSEANGLGEKIEGLFAAMDGEGKGYLVLRDLFAFSDRFEDLRPTAAPAAAATAASSSSVFLDSPASSSSPSVPQRRRRRCSSVGGVPTTVRGHLRHFFGMELEDVVRAADPARAGRVDYGQWTRFALAHPEVVEVFFQFYQAHRGQQRLNQNQQQQPLFTAAANARAAAARAVASVAARQQHAQRTL